jgi:hypothetical protein
MPRIAITDDNENWLKWGRLVREWINDPQKRPTNVGQLRDQWNQHGISATVDDAPGSTPGTRKVEIEEYSDDPREPVEIYIPSRAMLAAKLEFIGRQPGPYPYSLMPLFYNTAFAEARRADLSVAEKEAFALRRIGEYTVNECC